MAEAPRIALSATIALSIISLLSKAKYKYYFLYKGW
jgi:hypothetical protein